MVLGCAQFSGESVTALAAGSGAAQPWLQVINNKKPPSPPPVGVAAALTSSRFQRSAQELEAALVTVSLGLNSGMLR